ncbi:hypothetical protein Sru01_63610 [Sphaerisporangium rufum]|uniref:DUF397 domain-containing protein n=1 Tax=Sphaerisporangium rufum TaxID=1381558 RepID=A0A919R8I8_9ACTN|nr:DUF397 domain-containing protein [Sphaerisporangium rufum]GII81379.1 hypothetical protein Sru01_63610 [Sphaerisporangium rufum]
MDMAQVTWRKSRRSSAQGGNCVEIGTPGPGQGSAGPRLRFVRDSKNPDGAVLALPLAEWTAFLHGVSAGTLR